MHPDGLRVRLREPAHSGSGTASGGRSRAEPLREQGRMGVRSRIWMFRGPECPVLNRPPKIAPSYNPFDAEATA